MVAEGELGAGLLVVGLVGAAFAGIVAAGVGLGGGADLAYAVFDQLVAHFGPLAGGDDDAGVGHGDADDGDDLHEVLVAHRVRDVLALAEGGSFGRLDAGEGDGVGAAAVVLFQMAGMLHDGEDLETVVDESEQGADAHVVDAAFLGAVHAGEAVEVVGLGCAGGVELGVGHGVVGLLEADIGAYLLGLELGVVLDAHGSQLDVDAADAAAFLVLGGIGAADGLDHVVGVVAGAFAADEQGALVAHAQQVEGLGLDFVEGEDFALQGLVVLAEAAVDAVVDAGVAGVDGCEEHQSASVDFVFAVFGGVQNLLDAGLVLDAQQFGHVLEVEALQLAGFVEDVVQLALAGGVVLQHAVELVAVDKILMSHCSLFLGLIFFFLSLTPPGLCL